MMFFVIVKVSGVWGRSPREGRSPVVGALGAVARWPLSVRIVRRSGALEDVAMARTGAGHSVMAHSFAVVPEANIPRSTFDRSHGWKTTFNESLLIPFFVDEVLPGDTLNLRSTLFGRLATPIYPIMDNLYLDVFYFFCPCRLVWVNFVRMFGEQDNPTDTTSYIVPTVNIPPGGVAGSNNGWGGFADMFGLPIGNPAVAAINVNALPFRAYNLIWNQWFRDENLQTSAGLNTGDSSESFSTYTLLPRGKRKDYFTGALPFPQKGPAVSLPLGTTAPVRTDVTRTVSGIRAPLLLAQAADGVLPSVAGGLAVTGGANMAASTTVSGSVGQALYPANLLTDLTSAAAATINQLRQAFQIQKIYERDARGGTRYIELIKSHFGVTSPDARLQRTEYLGGGSVPLNINPIAQTSGTGGTGTTTPLGNLAATGTVSSHGVGFTKSFTEHGYVIGLVNLRADITYQDGLDRMWTRSTRFDFYWPALSHIGEQAIRNDEIYCTGTPAQDTAVFGYQERYGEYRYKNSRVCGIFRSASPTPLDAWHLSQHFAALPVLNAAFVVDNPPISRVVAVPSQPRVILDVYHKYICSRPMPVYGVPGLIDHF